MNGDPTFDISDITQPPPSQVEQPPAVQKKPYWQVLDEHQQASAQEPEIAKLSLPEFSQKMNEVTGTNQYDEGLNDSWFRRAGDALERSLRHFGGTLPGEKRLFGLPTPSEMLGGPQTGFDVPAAAKEFGKSTATALGASPDFAEKIGAQAEGLPKMGLSIPIGAGLGPFGIPAVFGAETYGETGRALPALVSGATAWAIPEASKIFGQAALKALGAKTVGELAPEALALKPASEAAKLASQYAPALGWSPTALVQRAARVGGAQVGMLAAGQVGEAAQTAISPDLTWQQKLAQIGGQFSPSNLVASAIGQLPFTAYDIFNERTHPLAQLDLQSRAEFADRFKAYAMRGSPEGAPFVPTEDQINRAIQALTKGEVEPPSSPVGQVLKSMGDLPLVRDYKTPVHTVDEAVPMPLAMNATRDRVQSMLRVQGVDRPIGNTYDQAIYDALRGVETTTGGKGTKEDTVYQAASVVANRYLSDQAKLDTFGKTPSRWLTEPTDEEEAVAEHNRLMTEVSAAIRPPTPDNPNPNYDEGAHQRIALTSGDPEHWIEAGIKGPVMFNPTAEIVKAISELGGPGAVPIEVARGVKRPQTLDRSIIDKFTGLRPKPTLDPAIVDLQRQRFPLERERRTLEAVSTPTPEQADRLSAISAQIDDLNDRIGKLQTADVRTRTIRQPVPVTGGQPQGAIWGTSTAEAIRRAYNYGKSLGDQREGRTLKLDDPASVSEFMGHVIRAMKKRELDMAFEQAGMKRTAEENLLEDKYATKNEAKIAADNLNVAAADAEGDWVSHYRPKRDRNGDWRVNERKIPKVKTLVDERPSSLGQQMEEATFEDPGTLAGQGVDIGPIASNIYYDTVKELGKLDDPAEASARKEALASNVIHYLNHLSDEEFSRIILGHAEAKYGEAGKSIRLPSELKKRMVKYVQFIRDYGPIDTKIEHYTPALESEKKYVRELREQRLTGETRPVPATQVNPETGLLEVVPDTEVLKKLTQLHGPRLIAPDIEQRRRLEQYMGEHGFGVYSAKHARAGQPRLDDWNAGKVSNLNFFEQFGALMADLRQRLPDPRMFKDAGEMLPMGDFGYVPPGFRDKMLERVLVKWGPGMPTRPAIRLGEKRGEYPPTAGKYDVLSVRDRSGKDVELEVPVNPLMTFFDQSTRHDYTMPLGQLLDLFEQHGALDDTNKAMLAVARKLSDPRLGGSVFIRDMPVGVNIANDPADKAYYATDGWASSAGMLLSPYKLAGTERVDKQGFAEQARFQGGRWVREMMSPNEIFPHLMNEVGHAASDFAYMKDLPFRREIDKVFNYVNEHVQDMQLSTGGKSEWTQDQLHSLTNPREFLAGIFNDNRLHQLLSTIRDPFDPLPGMPTTGPAASLFDRIRMSIANMLRNLFGIGATESTTLLDRMTDLATRGFEMQQRMNLRHRGDVYQEAIREHLIGGVFQPPGEPVREIGVKGEGMVVPPYTPTSVEELRQVEDARRQPPAAIWSVIRNHESLLATAREQMIRAAWSGDPEAARVADEAVRREELALRSLNRMRLGRWASPGVLRSRLVPDERETDIPKPVFNIAGRKGTLLRDPVVNNIVTTFTAGQNVKDAFSGSGQLSTFAKRAGANNVSLNVFNPAMHSVFDEIKSNPNGFGRRVANVARLIDARRDAPPRMRDGSDLRTYLDQVQARDPNVGLFLKQNLSFYGREVGKEGAFTPAPMITNQGLSELPSRIRQFSKSVDAVTHGNGWDVVANAQPGERVMVDPPYIAERTRYGEPAVSPEQRVVDYEKYLYPAAERGANFLVFDIADQKLMDSLADHGFTVQPIQRTARVGRVPKTEFVAYNHNGEMLPSRVDGHAVLDSMKSAALYVHEDPDRIWFRPYDSKYFQSTYGPAFGFNLRWEPRGDEIGYSIPRTAPNGLTSTDLSLMPRPVVKPWAPSLFETLQGMFREQGSDPQTASAIASQMVQFGALLRDTDRATWGRIPPEQKEHTLLGRAWGWRRVAGVSPEAVTGIKPLDYTIRHESAHLAGLHSNVETEPPDVRDAYNQVTDVFNQLRPEGRQVFLEGLGAVTTPDGVYPGFYPNAVTNPAEFAADFMGHVGDVITNLPKASAYLRDEMRFVPDEMSRLLVKNTLRRMQGLDRLVRLVEGAARMRGITDVDWSKMVNDTAEAFKPLARSALEIANDQAEFYRMRNLYPDMYKGLLNVTAQSLENFATTMKVAGRPEPTPTLPGVTILPSREYKTKTEQASIAEGSGLNNFIRQFFPLPDSSGKLPVKLGFWDRWLTQFSQLADKYPQMRSFQDMFTTSKAIYNNYRTKMTTALAGAFEGNKITDDARTKAVAEFQSRPDLRKAFSGLSLEVNAYGDHLFDEELADKGSVMAMNPQAVTGWLTPEWIRGVLKKYGVADKDIPTMMTVLDGTRNQIKFAQTTILGSTLHRMDAAIAVGVARNASLPPEASRQAAKLLTDAVKMQETNFDGAMDKIGQFKQIIKDPNAFGRMFDAANTMWDNVKTLERFLELRMPYFMSERRPGQFGLFFKDANGKVTSRYFRNTDERNKYIISNKIDPVRQTNPGDRDWGISPQIFKQLDDVQARTAEKLKNMFGDDEGGKLAATMDFASELRDALNSRDVLKLTTGRDLAPGREDLDMFSAHQQYINSVGKAAYNTFIRLEAELLNTDPQLVNQPAIKDYVNRQVKQILVPDSPIGRLMQNLSFLYYLFANPSSMIMQSSHQIMGLAPMLTARGASIAGSFNTIKKANQMLIDSRIKGKYADPMIDQMVDQARRDGSLGSWTAQEMNIGQDQSMINRMRATTGKGLWQPFDVAKNRLYQGYDLMRRLYDMVPKYNAEVALVASLLHLRSEAGGSLTGDTLYKEAQNLRSITMFLGGKENRPGFFQVLPRSAAQGLWSLQTYANGLTTMMGELIRRSVSPPKGFTPAQTKQVRKAAAQMLFTQTAVAGVLGMPFAQAALYALQKLFPDHNIELDIREALASIFGDDEHTGNVFSTAMTEGVPSAMGFPADMGSRFALAGTFHVSPYSGVGWEQLAGPTGGLVSRALESLQAGVRGDPVTAVEQLMPNGFQRIWKTLEQGSTYQTESGQTIVANLRPEEIVSRMLGFGVGRVAKIQDFERLSRVSESAEKAKDTAFFGNQVGLLKQNRDADVQQNIAQYIAKSGGVKNAQEVANAIAREYERSTMPANLRAFGNRATIRAQRSLLGILGPQDEGPSNVERLQLQQSIAQRLGLGGPRPGNLRHAANVDSLLSMYPHLTNAQANLLLTHAAASRPSPELYSELLGAY